MKVAVSVLGRFHAFDLARELDALGALQVLVTSYPRFAAARFGVDPNRMRSLPAFELAARAWQRTSGALHEAVDGRLHAAFATAVGRNLPRHLDLLTGCSGATLEAIEPARRRGAKVVLERGSAHIDAQTELLREAYAGLALVPRLPHPRTVARELSEYAEVDAIAVPSSFAARTFRERGFEPERLIVAPYGVDLERFVPPAERRPGLRVLFVGRASVQKGTHLLVEAFEAACPGDAELWLVGGVEPGLEPLLERSRRVRRFGPLDQSELPAIYARAHVFCLPSIQDGFGMVLTQAAASGLPLVASTHTGAPDLIEDGVQGALVPPGDVHALAEALARYASDPDRARRHGLAAAERVRAGLSWSDYGRRVHAAYAQLLGPSAATSRPDAAFARAV